ncbi:hypothetical protein FQN50_002914 [Emmonsiellopsis sp. PD_5]|nr:hypothetical protein FQN50_002914 [Emmonsiellopsis sp. PD_5]
MHLHFVTVLSLLAAASQGYILDSSCTKDVIAENFMTVNIGWAFESARIARDALRRRPWNEAGDGPLLDLASWIFKDNGSAPQISLPQGAVLPPDLDDPEDPRGNLDKLRDVFTQILDMERRSTNRVQPEVEIFCDLSRYGEPDTVRERVLDKTKQIFFFTTGNPKYDCSAPAMMAWLSSVQKAALDWNPWLANTEYCHGHCFHVR